MVAASLGAATSASAATRPSIISESATAVIPTDATLTAQINPNGFETTYRFWLIFPPCGGAGFCDVIPHMPLPQGTLAASGETQEVSIDINSAEVTLDPGTTYRFYVEATSSAGSVTGPERSFTTTTPRVPSSVIAPSIESEWASHITATDATLGATINPGGLATTYKFRLEWGCGIHGEICPMYCTTESTLTESECGGHHVVVLPSGEIPPSFEGKLVSLDLSAARGSLQPGTEYRYRVEAFNSAGSTRGRDQFFTTQPRLAPPTIGSESVSAVTSTDATLEADINPDGLETTYHFWLQFGCFSAHEFCQWVITEELPAETLPASFENHRVSVDLNEAGVTLEPGWEYRYCVVASNAAGKESGPIQTFTTLMESGPTNDPPTAAPFNTPSPSGASQPSSPKTGDPAQPSSRSTSSAALHRRHGGHRRHHRHGRRLKRRLHRKGQRQLWHHVELYRARRAS